MAGDRAELTERVGTTQRARDADAALGAETAVAERAADEAHSAIDLAGRASQQVRVGARQGLTGSGEQLRMGTCLDPPMPAGTRRISMRRWAVAVALGDGFIAGWVGAASVLARFGVRPESVDGLLSYWFFAAGIAPVWVAMTWLGGGYDVRFMTTGAEEYHRVANAGVRVLALAAVSSYAFRADVSRSLVAIALPLATVATLSGHYSARQVLRRRLRGGRSVHQVVVVGAPGAISDLIRHIHRAPHIGFAVVGAFTPNAGEFRAAMLTSDEATAAVTGVGGLVAAVGALGADTIAVADGDALGRGELRRLSWALEGTGISLLVAPAVTDIAGPRIVVRPAEGLPLLHIEEPAFHGARRLLKGMMDRVLASLGILILSPVMLAIAASIKLSDGGPVFFRQARVGRMEREFMIWKFRTMRLGAETEHEQLLRQANHNGILFKLTDDPRVTRTGRWLRRYSLDELPQLFNVMSGTMSLVGPRPQRPLEVAHYAHDARRRLLVKPGITGLWQVSGRSQLTWEETVQLDLHYVENWSVLRDALLLLRTFRAVVRGAGAW